jgi:pimeloyl-ACP methyl ester carboxylesterase
MVEVRQITTAPDLRFDVLVGGPEQGAPVLLLHGFAESFHHWDAQIAALAGAGYHAIAPSQRGYSPAARPDPANTDNYVFDKLVHDPMQIASALGLGRFHLVGHDWGGSLAWGIADRTPERLASLAVLSRPHPVAFNRALALPDGEQKRRSQHHSDFLAPGAVSRLVADDARWLRERLARNHVPAEAIDRHVAVLGNAGAMEAALAWYRARGTHHAEPKKTVVPTLYIWGDADDTVGRAAAEGTADCVSAPYRFEVLPGGGHFCADQFPEKVSALLLAHIAGYPA